MARSVITDLLQSHAFWLTETGPLEVTSLPFLTPMLGFSAITAPEIQVDVQEITEGNWFFKKQVVKGASVSNMTLQRGIAFYDSDFWRWILAAASGVPNGSKLLNVLPVGGITPRRTFMLVQFLPRNPLSLPEGSDVAIQAGLKIAGAAFSNPDLNSPGLSNPLGAAVLQGVASGLLSHFGPFEFVARLPAKAWILHNCIPVRYKAGTDFEGSNHNISIQELEIAVEIIEEIALAA